MLKVSNDVKRKRKEQDERNRQLVAQAAGYALSRVPSYGLNLAALPAPPDPVWDPAAPFAVLLHSTAREEKLWPEPLWIALARDLQARLGIRSVFPWGSGSERERSERLAGAVTGAQVPQRTALAGLAQGMARARVVVGVDTGLLHLASAVDVPCVGIYVATDPARNGLYPASAGINLGGVGALPCVDEVLVALQQVTARVPA
jgi:heptosyltransferase-1